MWYLHYAVISSIEVKILEYDFQVGIGNGLQSTETLRKPSALYAWPLPSILMD